MKGVFMTSDGKIFESEAKAAAHEKMAKYHDTIMEWAEQEYEGKQGMATRATNIVISWELVREQVIEKAMAAAAAKEAEVEEVE